MKLYLIVLICSFLMVSCKYEEAKISVRNNVHNATLTNINWGDKGIYSSLIPGTTSDKIKIEDKEDKWPKTGKITFNMQANNKTVYLETVQSYTLLPGQDLLIIIADTTAVTNPMLKK